LAPDFESRGDNPGLNDRRKFCFFSEKAGKKSSGPINTALNTGRLIAWLLNQCKVYRTARSHRDQTRQVRYHAARVFTPEVSAEAGEMWLFIHFRYIIYFSASKDVWRKLMSIARVTEIIAGSPKSFDDAIENGVKRAAKTLTNVKAAWVQDQNVVVEGDKITEYRVTLKVTFVLE